MYSSVLKKNRESTSDNLLEEHRRIFLETSKILNISSDKIALHWVLFLIIMSRIPAGLGKGLSQENLRHPGLEEGVDHELE
jgi:hypothetical protein